MFDIPTKINNVPAQLNDLMATKCAAILLASLRLQRVAVLLLQIFSVAFTIYILKYHRIHYCVGVLQFPATSSLTKRTTRVFNDGKQSAKLNCHSFFKPAF